MAAHPETESLPSYTEATRVTNKRKRSNSFESIVKEGEATNENLINAPRKRKKPNGAAMHEGLAAGEVKASAAHGKVVENGEACALPVQAKRVRRPAARSDSKAFLAKRQDASGSGAQQLPAPEDESLLVTKPVSLTKERPGSSPSAPSSSAGLKLPMVDWAKAKYSLTSPTRKQNTPTFELRKCSTSAPSVEAANSEQSRVAHRFQAEEHELEALRLEGEATEMFRKGRELQARAAEQRRMAEEHEAQALV